MLWKYFNLVINKLVCEQINHKIRTIIFCHRKQMYSKYILKFIYYKQKTHSGQAVFVFLFCFKGQLAITLKDKVRKVFLPAACQPFGTHDSHAKIPPSSHTQMDGWTAGQSTSVCLFHDLLPSAADCRLLENCVFIQIMQLACLGRYMEREMCKLSPIFIYPINTMATCIH